MAAAHPVAEPCWIQQRNSRRTNVRFERAIYATQGTQAHDSFVPFFVVFPSAQRSRRSKAAEFDRCGPRAVVRVPVACVGQLLNCRSRLDDSGTKNAG